MQSNSLDNEETNVNGGGSRRNFLRQTAVATALIATIDPLSFAAKGLIDKKTGAKDPWFSKVLRWGQVNITEKDPPSYDIAWWRKQWKRTETQGVVINAGGIVAYYPSKIPLHRKAEYLGDKDLFGSLCHAAHEDGLAVFARMDSNRAHEEFYKAHPDWFAVDISGKPYKADELFITCVNSSYYNDHIPAILREITELYKPEGFTDNSWSGLGRESICYCENCRKRFRAETGGEIPIVKNWDDKTYREWIEWNYARRLEIWDLNNKTTKAAGGVNCIWSGMNSGSIGGQSRSFRNYREICKRADILMLDDQARNDAEGFQHNGYTGKLIHGLLGWDKLIPESMAMYQAGRPTFRLASKPKPEARMWMLNGIAGGIQPWWHHVAAYHEDRRMYATAAPVLRWHKANEEFLINRQPVATIGVVWSQRNTDYYGRDNDGEKVELPWRGMTLALTRARIPYLPVHADHIDRDGSQFSVLVLPNLAAMSDNQVAMVKRFVERGGSLVATGETSLFDGWGDKRPDYALADMFGIHTVVEGNSTSAKDPLEKLSGNVYHTYLRLTPELRALTDGPTTGMEPSVSSKRHAILQGFDQTDILPFGGLLQPLKTDSGAEVLMTFIPQFPVYPPETAWMRQPKTDIPGLIISTTARGSRIVFMPADIDRQFGLNNLPDHGNLLRNIVRWAAKGNIPLIVEGAGLVDCHIYKQAGRLVLHVVNLTSTATWRQPLDEFISIGPLKIGVKLPGDVRGGNCRSLVAGQKIKVTIKDGWVRFEIKSLIDHEVVVIS
ncbi:MAG: beta-galactosidase [Ginsengibacter sp.]